MAFIVNFTPEFKEWFDQQEKALQRTILIYVGLLEEKGPQLSRPQADTLKGSSLSKLKELRIQHRGNPYRALYAFDPKRQAILLVAGNKANDKKWYDKMIPKAEQLFKAHLEALAKEES